MKYFLTIVLLLVFITITLHAEDKAKNKKISSKRESRGIFSLITPIYNLETVDKHGNESGKKYYAPSQSEFYIIGETDNYYTLSFDYFYGKEKEKEHTLVTLYQNFTIKKEDLPETSYDNYMVMNAGILAVPFKYYFSDDKEVSLETTTGGYIGITSDYALMSGTLIFSLSTTPAKYQEDKEGEATLEKLGISAAVGYLANLGDFQMGIIIGYDVYKSNKNWDNFWISFSTGYNFLN